MKKPLKTRRGSAPAEAATPPHGLAPGLHPMEHRLAPVASFDIEARTVEVTWTTGAAVRRKRFDFRINDFVVYDEILEVSKKAIDMTRLKNAAPVLDSHDGFSTAFQVGVVEKAWLDGKEGRAIIRFPKAGIDENADRLAALVADKIIRSVSVGYSVDRIRIVPPKKDGDIEQRIVEAWTPYEISFVTMGADPGAQVRGEEFVETRAFPIEYELNRATPKTKESPMDEEDIETGAAEDGADDERSAAAKAKPAAKPAPSAAAQVDEAEIQRRADAEVERRAVLDQFVTRHTLGEDFRKKHAKSSAHEIKRAAYDVLFEREKASVGVTNVSDPLRVTEAAEDKFLRGAEASIIVRAGHGALIAKAAGKAPDPGEYRNFRLIDLGREYLEMRGEKTRGLSPDGIYRAAFGLEKRGAGVGFGGQNTGDFGVLLENTMNKILLGAYATQPDTWQRFCKPGSVTDFRINNRYRLGSFGSLDSLNEQGEFKQKTIPDGEKFTIQAATKGNIIGLSRQAIINDDLGAFSDLATMFGRAAKLSVEKDVYALLAQNAGLGPTLSDGLTLFHATHGNIASAGAISVDVFDDAGVKMALQTDASGNEILDLQPKVLLVSRAASGNARVIIGAEFDPDTPNKLQKPNKVRGIVSDIVASGRLAGTRFYMFADPSIAPVIEVAFLNGMSEPFLDSDEGWRMDGVEWKVRLDYGVAGQDFRGAVTGAGV